MTSLLNILSTIARFSVILLLTSCFNQRPQAEDLADFAISADKHHPAHYFLDKADLAPTSKEGDYFRILAVRQLLLDHDIKRAERVIHRISLKRLPPELQPWLQLYRARFYLLSGDISSATERLNVLDEQDMETLTPAQQHYFYETRAMTLAQSGDILASVQTRVYLDSLMSNRTQQLENNQRIWQLLETVPTPQLKSAAETASIPTVKGWFELALLRRQRNFAEKLQNWMNANSEHPASRHIRTIEPTASIHKLALLLPLHGPYAGPGKALENGIFATYFQEQRRGKPTPKIKVYNTNDEDIDELYQKALDEGADFVIGPFLKDNVTQLSHRGHFPVPTLALNYATDGTTADQFYQLGLSPEDEALAIAKKAALAGHQNALLVTVDTPTGNRIADTLTENWQRLGGHVQGKVYLTDQTLQSKAIEQGLNVSSSEARARGLKRLIGKQLNYNNRRRQDIDIIFLAAPPQTARQVQPLLRFYYAGNLPVYATSWIYSGIPNSKKYRDLNGVIFCDIPWSIEHSSQNQRTKRYFAKSWPSSYRRYSRLYALGSDAYVISTSLEPIKALTDLGIYAKTGMLHSNDQQRLKYHLQWGKFTQGNAVKLKDS